MRIDAFSVFRSPLSKGIRILGKVCPNRLSFLFRPNFSKDQLKLPKKPICEKIAGGHREKRDQNSGVGIQHQKG
jgi:hypothetical protein